jgi:MbtH protein
MAVEEQDSAVYKVVVNRQVQYWLWPVDQLNPLGWVDSGKSGTKEECLEYIKEGRITVNSQPGVNK